jgi:hypothetical protein
MMKNMDKTLNRLKDVRSDCCVTILLNTHRHAPESKKDEIVLKNLVSQAENRLKENYDNETGRIVTDKLKDLASSIDARYNFESLALFVSPDVAEFTRMPIEVEDRVIIGETFSTRDLIRMLHKELNYYILVLSRERARLIEAAGDKEIQEIHSGFPMENSYTVPGEGKLFNRETGLVMEFYRNVNDQLDDVMDEKKLPVFVCTDSSNFADYLEAGGDEEKIAGHIDGNKDQEDPHNIVQSVWPKVQQWHHEKNDRLLTQLTKNAGAGDFETDLSEIWKAIIEGKGSVLYVKEGFIQPAKVENNVVEPADENSANVDDIIDEMIEKNNEFGGETVFVSGDELEEYNGLALLKRFD